MSRRQTIREKIMSRVRIETETGCWIWTGPTSGETGRGRGYPRMWLGGQTVAVHITMWIEESELRDGEQNRGWLGDSFDRLDGEDVLGSRLWLLTRRSIYDGIEVDAQDYAREALEPLVTQGAVASVDAVATTNRAENRLDLAISLYGRDGEAIYNQKFGLLWRQIDGVEYPLAG
jgi:phage gp46-like protein